MVSLYRRRCAGGGAGSQNHTANMENRVNSFSMRPEQQEAVDKTAAYFQSAYEEDSTPLP